MTELEQLTVLEQLQEEQERLVHDFTSAMAEWLEQVNKSVDRILDNYKEIGEFLRDQQT